MPGPAPESTIFVDPRRGGRAMRVTWHAETPDREGLVVISLWRDNLCVGSFRLPAGEVPELVHALTRGLVPSRDPMVDTA